MFVPMDYSDCVTGDLNGAIVALETLISSARRQQLAMIAEVDRREGYRDDDMPSMPAWLALSLDVTEHMAREYVRVAHALEECPNIADGLAHGDLSFQKVQQATRVADASSDEHWAVEAKRWSVRQLRLIADRARDRSAAEAQDAHERREVRYRWEQDGTMCNLSAKLPGEQGAAVVKALERMAEHAAPNPDTGAQDGYRQRMADALYELASGRIGADPDPDRATIVIHTDVEAARGHLEDGGPLASETLRRLLCDGRVQYVYETDGRPVGIGRLSRVVLPSLARIVKERDNGCRFPGCGRTRWVHAHHIVPWSEGGPTDLENLCLLCPMHHRLVHELGWRIQGHPDGDLLFIHPDGRGELPLPEPDPISRERFDRLLDELIRPPPVPG